MVDDDGNDIPIVEPEGGTLTGLTCDRRIRQQKFWAKYTVENCAGSEAPGKSSKSEAGKSSKSRASRSSKGKVTVTATTDDGTLVSSRILKCNK